MFSIGVILRTIASYVFRVFPIKENRIYCSNFCGRGYGDNPKYICEALLKSEGNYDIVWEVNNMNEEMPIGVRKVKNLSFRDIYEATTSKIWIDNARKNIWFRKRKKQLYIQTWHGGIGFKKVEADSSQALPDRYVIQAKHDSDMMDCLLSGSQWSTEIYSNVFWFSGPILKTGLPRQDILIDLDKEKSIELKNKIGIPAGYRVITYAPTFRKDMTDYSIYDLKWENITDALSDRFGGEWIGAIRLHPGLVREYNSKNKNCIDLSKHPDSQEVLAISDIVITDYSSVVFDHALTGKPSFIYATDLEEYRKDRDVYFDFDSIPFPFAETQEQLVNNIKFFDLEKYQKELKHFLCDECGVYPIRNASQNVCSIIQKYIEGQTDYLDQFRIND